MRRLLLSAALLISLSGCGENEPSAAATPTPTATTRVTLPDGSTATPQESAFLDDALPQLSEQRAADPAGVLNEGQGFCDVYTDPADPAIQAQAVEVLVGAGWTITDAQVTVRAAAEHLC